MDELKFVQYWEFEVCVTGSSKLLISNAVIVNLICSTLANSDCQVVVKIKTMGESCGEIIVYTLGEEARCKLLTNYRNTFVNELKVVGEAFSDISILSFELVHMGMILNASDQEFEDVKKDVQNTLASMVDNQRPGQSELFLSNSSIVVDDNRIIKEIVTPTTNLLENVSSSINDSVSNTLNSSPTPSFSSPPQPKSIQSVPSVSLPDTGLLSKSASAMSSVYESLSRLKINGMSSFRNGATNYEKSVETEELQLRDYQEELAQPGREGNNCIILAPTGSGKTIVAASICKQVIEKKSPKILFLVPRVPLVNQQFKVFQKYLGNIVFQVSGDKGSNVPVEVFIEKHIMTVMTAQILHNLLQKGLIKFEDIDLIIFDECHHTMKKHVYCKIMELYMDKRLSRSNSKLPQIVGLTASVGVGKAKSEEKAEENIKTLMANLDVTMPPVQVREHMDSLGQFQNDANDELFTVTRHADDEFATKIATAMFEIETMLPRLFELYINVLSENKPQIKPPMERGTQSYEEWVVHLLQDSTLIKHSEASPWFRAFAKHLRKYNDALIMNDHVRGTDVKEYLEDFLGDQPPNEMTTLLQDVYRRNEPRPTEDTNPLLEKLREILTEHYELKPHSRCILFVRTRPIAHALINYLADQPLLSKLALNAKLLTGTNAKSENLGMTKTEQEDALRNFRSGNCKVLVSTSVAEEGLDIKACNLIITYNYATNEVGKVQRKGRGRAEDSRSIILSYSDSGIVPRESGNDQRVKLGKEMLKKIRNINPYVLKSEIEQIQTKAKDDRDFEARIKILSMQNGNSSAIYKLRCKNCKKLITTSKHIRRVENAHHVVVDESFQMRAMIYPIRPPFEVAPGIVVTGKIKCKDFQCREIWGSCMNHRELPMYVVKGNCFILSEGEEELDEKDEKWCEVQRWSDVPFYNSIKELEPPTSFTTHSVPVVGLDESDSEEEEFDYSQFD